MCIRDSLQPACVDTCVGRALIFGDANDPNSAVSQLLKAKEWQKLVTDEVNIVPNPYYYTAGKAIPDSVMPKLNERHLSGTLMENIVNPLGTLGIGGMMAVFLGAGIKKLIDRRQDVSNKEGSHEQH